MSHNDIGRVKYLPTTLRKNTKLSHDIPHDFILRGKRVISSVVWLISDIGKRGNYAPFTCTVRGEPEKELGSQALLERLEVPLVWDFVARWRGFAAPPWFRLILAPNRH